MKIGSHLFVFIVACFCSCSKSNSTGNNSAAPANLTVLAVVNPDNSGTVSFTSSATNAVTYEYDYGNGIYAIANTGIVIYKYPISGTYTVNVTAKSAGGQTVSKSIQVTVVIKQNLIWADEFNTPGMPDPAKWGYDIGTGSGGWGNNELEYYTDRTENVTVSGGTLKIIAKKENYSGSSYTSARLLSKNKFSFKYGKVEVKAKIPAGVGTWPAIWMLGSNINTAPWPACGEIDIMEHVGKDLNRIYGTLHYPGRSGGNADGNTKIVSDATTAFHIYSLEWSASLIKILVDGNVIHTVSNTSNLPFNQDFFLLLNVAMGGNFGGAVDASIASAQMEIDYIRIYQ